MAAKLFSFLRPSFLTVKAPRTVEIYAPVSAVALRLMWILILFVALWSIWVDRTFAKKMPATGFIKSMWLGGTDMRQNMNTRAQEAFCTSPYSFDYKYCNHSSAEGSYNEFWCEDNIQCLAIDDGAAMVKRSNYDFWAMTYLKQKRSRAVPCDEGASACDATQAEVFQTLVHPSSCRCVRTSNYFVVGPEDIRIGFRPQVRLGDVALPADGYVPLSLYVKRVDAAAGEWTYIKEVQRAGDVLTFLVAEMLEWVGFADGLDSRDESIGNETHQDGRTGNPSLRITGVSFEIRITIHGTVERPLASVYVTPVDGWHALGDDWTLNDLSVTHAAAVASGEASYGDDYGVRINNYRRGVQFNIAEISGTIEVFDAYTFLTNIASWFVYLGMASMVTRYAILHLLGYTSRVYRGLTSERVSVSTAHEHKSAEALLHAAVYQLVIERAKALAKSDGLDENAAMRTASQQMLGDSGLTSDAASALVANLPQVGFSSLSSSASTVVRNIEITEVAEHSRSTTRDQRAATSKNRLGSGKVEI